MMLYTFTCMSYMVGHLYYYIIYCKFINVHGVNVCIFETKPCSRALIFAVNSSGLVSYLVHELCLQGMRNSPNKSLANINEFTVCNFWCKLLITLILSWLHHFAGCRRASPVPCCLSVLCDPESYRCCQERFRIGGRISIGQPCHCWKDPHGLPGSLHWSGEDLLYIYSNFHLPGM